jgi:hypothetical protein
MFIQKTTTMARVSVVEFRTNEVQHYLRKRQTTHEGVSIEELFSKQKQRQIHT